MDDQDLDGGKYKFGGLTTLTASVDDGGLPSVRTTSRRGVQCDGSASYDAKDGQRQRGNPSAAFYGSLITAFRFFNNSLFHDSLPPCLITVQRKAGSRSFFNGGCFTPRHGNGVTDEIALNPSEFTSYDDRDIMATLVREMTHLWQFHWGKPATAGYCNQELASKLEQIGLIPSSTNQPGGDRTGRKVGQFIEIDGPFDRACHLLLQSEVQIAYEDLGRDTDRKATREKKAASKTRYSCIHCKLNVWGKPAISVICGSCLIPLSSNRE